MIRDLDALRPRSGMWLAVGLLSILAHGAVAAGLASYDPPPPPPVLIDVEVRMVQPPPPEPPPPPPPEPEPEKPPEPPPPPPEPETPREAVKQDDPPPPPKKKPRRKKPKAPDKAEPPKPDPAPPPAEPAPDKAPEPPPMAMGLGFEGLATSANGVAVPEGARDGARDGASGGTGRKGPRAPTTPGPGDTADETVPIAGVTSLPRLTKEVKPDFPDDLKRKGIEGKVVLSLEIGSNGRVKKARVVARLHPELDRLARRAALKLRFEPAKVRGTPVAVNLPYTFYFVID